MLKLGGWPRLTWGRRPRQIELPGGAAGSSEDKVLQSSSPRSGHDVRLARSTTTHRAPPTGTASSSADRAQGHGGPMSASGPQSPRMARERGRAERLWRDAQAGVPSAGWPRAQLAFKDSMVRGILQFTPRIAFRYVLHRCESRDIRCRESFQFQAKSYGAAGIQAPPARACSMILGAPSRRGFC